VLVLDGELSAGALVAFGMYAGLAMAPLVSLITLWDEVQLARAALGRIEEVRRQPPERQPGDTRGCPVPLRGRVRFEQVRFCYDGPDAPEVLRGVTFELGPSERVALVGRSGSGKTTVARLLLGLYRPTGGRVLVDGLDLAELDPAAYRRQVGVVLQENLLFSGTVRDNIALGEDRPEQDRVESAARLACAHDFIAGLPQAYDTVVGEQGLTLSGGQRQRVSLARALYRDPRLLIFDEALGSLDGDTLRAVHRNLPAMLAGRTALIIAHHGPTIRLADRILVLEDGVIVEQGTHAELTDRRGLYCSLAAGQESP
jgi:ATP-binding cassette subfamily B protein